MSQYRFDLPQVKQDLISSKANLGKSGKFKKTLNLSGGSQVASLPAWIKIANNNQKLYKNKFLKSPMDYLTP